MSSSAARAHRGSDIEWHGKLEGACSSKFEADAQTMLRLRDSIRGIAAATESDSLDRIEGCVADLP